MNDLFLPLLLPALTAAVTIVWTRPSAARSALVLASCVAQLVLALKLFLAVYPASPAALSVGNWAVPYGIVLYADTLTGIMLVFASGLMLAATCYSECSSPRALSHPLRLPLLQFLLLGVNLCLLTGDLFNLFVSFELMLIASYALIGIEADDWDIRQALPYVLFNVFGSAVFLLAVGLAYGLFGSLNYADLAVRSSEMAGDPRILPVAALLLMAFAIKAGMFPLYYWLPNSYPVLPMAVGVFFSGMLTKVAIYVLMRVFGTVFPAGLPLVPDILLWGGAATMLVGVWGAVARHHMRAIFSYHIISQIGYMLMAVGLFTPVAFAAALFHLLHNTVVKSSLFMTAGTAAMLNRTDDIRKMGNLWRQTPYFGILFLFLAMSLAGLPPTSGFWGKFLVIFEALGHRAWLLAAAAALTSFFTLFCMVKIWLGPFLTDTEEVPVDRNNPHWRATCAVISVMALVSLAMGLGAALFLEICMRAAECALDQDLYIRTVMALGGKGS